MHSTGRSTNGRAVLLPMHPPSPPPVSTLLLATGWAAFACLLKLHHAIMFAFPLLPAPAHTQPACRIGHPLALTLKIDTLPLS
jgi:hypothetical protein